jgi:hypothetical protein
MEPEGVSSADWLNPEWNMAELNQGLNFDQGSEPDHSSTDPTHTCVGILDCWSASFYKLNHMLKKKEKSYYYIV